MITATIAAIDCASADLAHIKVTWSHGETQTRAATWTGFFRGGTGAHINGEEIQYVDGTEMNANLTVMDAFVAKGGVVGKYIPEAGDDR